MKSAGPDSGKNAICQRSVVNYIPLVLRSKLFQSVHVFIPNFALNEIVHYILSNAYVIRMTKSSIYAIFFEGRLI